MEIKIKCKGSGNRKLAGLKILQGELKGLSDESRAKLRKRIEKYGFDAPFFVYKSWVLDGTQRLRVLQSMIEDGCTLPKGEVPVVEIKADSIADAKERILGYVSQFGKLSSEGLSEFIVDLPDIDFDLLDLPDFDIEAFLEDEQPGNEGLTDPDDVPEPPKKAITKPGDLWILGDHRLLCGDSTKKKDVERLMGGAKAELCFTSPPYADQRTYGGGKNLSVDHLASFIPASAEWVDYYCVNLGIKRNDGMVVQYWQDYIAAAAECGRGILSWNVWHKIGGYAVGAITAMFPIDHEWIFVFGKSPRQLQSTVPNMSAGQKINSTNRAADGKIGGKKEVTIAPYRAIGTVVVMDSVNSNDDHPAKFPVELPEKYIEAFEGDVYDPFLGSGSTLIACEKTGRRCYGMEIDEVYCDVIIQRWQNYTGKKAVLDKKKRRC